MKMVKKVLMGLALCTAFSFVGCKGLLDAATNGTGTGTTSQTQTKDDDEGAIKGSGKKYTVSYANATEANYRAYKATALKHAGALIKVTFDSADVGKSKMGVIFDLNSDKTDKTSRNFYIIGLNPRTDVANFYVSKFENVTDIQATNFGAPDGTKVGVPSATEGASETAYVILSKDNNITVPAAASDGSISFYVYYKLKTDGSFVWAVLDMTDDQMNDFNSKVLKAQDDKIFDAVDIHNYTVLKEGTISGAYEPAASDKTTDITKFYNKAQKYLAYYAQIAAGQSLNGSWYVPSTTFHEAEDAE